MKKYLFLSLLIVFSSSVQALSPTLPDESFIYSFDKNGDGKLHLKEFLAVKKSSAENLDWDFPITQSSFKKLDLNKDVFLDYKDELPIYYSKEFSEYILCLPNCEQK